ncbi:hypothetical protein B0H19DRAFT_910442, partial [Mycena capillaripes]
SAILSPQIDTFIHNILAEWASTGGAAVAVVRMDEQGGSALETKGYSVATANGTIFSIGSNS